jgi:hypothetical protein
VSEADSFAHAFYRRRLWLKQRNDDLNRTLLRHTKMKIEQVFRRYYVQNLSD